ncbi:MAG: UvrD-helicase domain-containing protein [Candidatus Staskawiczbacteria bacterium]|jgi:DNA helicase-2/ATP-dependent DNA helicase PcrA
MPGTKIVKVIAGPGGGKTSGLVEEVLGNLDLLKPNRYFTVITYTNAATDKIRKELGKKIKIPPNIFIGTIHSFLNRFILLPHASKIGVTPSDIIFIDDLDIDDPRMRNVIIKRARDKGVITYEQIEWISEKIICGGSVKSGQGEVLIKPKIANIHSQNISKRIQCVFVDEYQDATIPQHNIFTKLISTNLIDYFYCVGDPEQYIYGFTYKNKVIKKPAFADLPIQKIDSIPDISVIKSNHNHRSSKEIVKFINNFSVLKQISVSCNPDGPPVTFISATNQEDIIKVFNSVCFNCGLENKKKFYLSHAKSTITDQSLVSIDQIVNPSINSERLLSETLRLICGISGKSQKEICKIKECESLELRRMALKILKIIKSNDSISEDNLKKIIKDDFGISIEQNRNYKYNNNNSLLKILSILKKGLSNPVNIKSTIHKSKGLEAEAVLTIAKSKDELRKWIETMPQKRSSDTADVCRIGFVSFSRPRHLLCIACLEDCEDIKNYILSLGVKII